MRLGLGLGLWRTTGRIIVPSALTDWYTRVLAVGGIVTQAQVNAVEALLSAYTAAGLTDATCRLNPYCGNNLAAALVPVLKGGGNPSDTNISFVAGDYSPATGLTGDGASKYLIPNVDINVLGLNGSWHQGVYSLNGSSRVGGEMGGFANSSGQALINVNTTSAGLRALIFAGTGSPVVAFPAPSICTRFVVGNRPALNDTRIITDGVERATGNPGGSIPAKPMIIHALWNNTAVSNWTARPLGGYSFGRHIPTASVAAVSAAWKTYSDIMGRVV